MDGGMDEGMNSQRAIRTDALFNIPVSDTRFGLGANKPNKSDWKARLPGLCERGHSRSSLVVSEESWVRPVPP